MNIDGIATIITGGASGLGRATALRLAQSGARVTVFDVNAKEGAEVAQETRGLFAPVDVTDEGSIAAGLDAAEAAHGPARVLVNCAGIAPAMKTVGKEGLPHSLDLYRKTIAINLVGAFTVLSQFAARLSALEPIGEERGVIVNTASVAAFEGQIGQAAYASSKAGVVGLTLPVARDLAALRIRVMAIAPGIFHTPMLDAFPQAVRDALGAQVPHPSRLGQPDEFARLVSAIIDNPMLNGEVIRLDGAIRMAPR